MATDDNGDPEDDFPYEYYPGLPIYIPTEEHYAQLATLFTPDEIHNREIDLSEASDEEWEEFLSSLATVKFDKGLK